MCIPFENVDPITPKAKECVTYLKVIAACEIVIALIKMIIFRDFVGGIYELISCMILWMSWAQLSYCLCLLYIVYICVLGSITYGVSLLTPVQNSEPFFGTTGLQHAQKAFTIIFLIFYIVSAYLAFQAYKEFKAQQYESGAGGNGFFGVQGAGRGQAVGGAQYSTGNRNNQNYGTNYSYGGQGSGDSEAYYPPSSNAINQQSSSTNNNAPASGNSGGGYFQGKGVRIG